MVRKFKKSEQITHVALVLDESGSMLTYYAPALQAFNQAIRDIKTQAYKSKQDTTITLVFFGGGIRNPVSGMKAQDVSEITYYNPCGGTPLYDSVGLATSILEGLEQRKNTANLVVCVTDGNENTSHLYGSQFNSEPFSRMITGRQATDRWTYTFQLPPNTVSEFSRKAGVPIGNCRAWEASEEGIKEMRNTISTGTQSYYSARSAGETKTSSFYTDLSGVTSQDLKKNLKDLSGHFRAFTVDREVGIQSFVEYKTGGSYITGAAYYTLSKPETVKGDRKILIQEKGSRKIWGGKEARDLVGLPTNQDAKVIPLNHADKDIFIESRSHNRKLVRGTKVLVDVAMRKPKTPTWSA